MARNHRTRGTCTYPGCNRPHESHGYCKGHDTQRRRGQELRPIGLRNTPKTCAFDGCDRKHNSHGYCASHVAQLRAGKPLTPIGITDPTRTCTTPDCGRPHCAKGLCKRCYNRARNARNRTEPAPRRQTPAAKPQPAAAPAPRPRLPKGWNKTTTPPAPKPRGATLDLGPVPPTDPAVLQRATEALRAHNALDLAPILGLEAAA